MDICASSHEASIYKVKVWTSATESKTFVFSGGAHHVPAKNEIVLQHALYHDDSIRVVRDKIIAFLPTQTTPSVFMWIDRRVAPSRRWLEAFATHLLRGRRDVDKEELSLILSDIGFVLPSTPSYNKYNFENIINSLKILRITKIPTPLGLTYTYAEDGYTYIGATNPFVVAVADRPRAPPIVEIVRDDTLTLEHFPIYGNTIHAVFSDSLMESNDWARHFFPWQGSNVDVEATRRAAGIMQDFMLLSRDIDTQRFKIACTLRALVLRVGHARTGIATNVDNVFDMMGTSILVPFIKVCSSHNTTRYKIHKECLMRNNLNRITYNTLEKWVFAAKRKSKTNFAYIEFKVREDNQQFISVRMHASDSRLDVRFLEDDGEFTFGDVVKAIPTINKFFKYLSTFVDNMDAKISREFWKRGGNGSDHSSSKVRILNLRSRLSIAEQKGTSDIESMKRLAESLYPILVVQDATVHTTNTTSRLTFNYKRIDNYTNGNNINRFIAMHASELDNNLASMMAQVFDISKDEAHERIDMYRTQAKKWSTHKLLANITSVTVNMLRLPFGEVQVDIDGVENVFYHKRLIRLLMFLLSFGSATALATVPFMQQKTKYNTQQAHDNDTDDDYHNDNAMSLHDFSESDDDGFVLDAVSEELGGVDTDDSDDEDEAGNKGKAPDDKMRYVLTMLRKADKDLFSRGYSRECQMQAYRQPIVVSQSELDNINKTHPGSYFDNYVKYGSTPEKAQKNIYICPEVWCPLSRVSMTKEQYDSGQGCPGGEPAIDTSDKKYYIDAATKKKKHRFVGFVGTGKCMPCCFSPLKPPSSDSKNMVKIHQCMLKSQESKHYMKDAAQHESVSVMNQTEKYVRGFQYPLDHNRMGLLPASVTSVLPSMIASKGSLGTGMMTDQSDFLVRRGVQTPTLLDSVELLLEKESILKDVTQSITVQEFLSLNQGELFKVFVDQKPPGEQDLRDFFEWMNNTNKNKDYTIKFNINTKALQDNNMTMRDKFKLYIRDYLVYTSFTRFLTYLLDENVPKTEDLVLDLLNRQDMRWGKGIVFLIIEMRGDQPYLVIGDRINRSSKSRYAIIVKQESYYEPVVRAYLKKGKLTMQRTFVYGEYAPTDAIIDYYYGLDLPQRYQEGMEASNVYAMLKSLKYNIRFQVIDYDFNLKGFVLGGTRGKGIFVPISLQMPIIDHKELKFIFIDELAQFLPWYEDKPAIVKQLLKTLHGIVKSDIFNVVDAIKDNASKKIVALKCVSGDVVPLDGTAIDSELYLDNLNMFIDNQLEDKRVLYIKTSKHRHMIYNVLRDIIMATFKQSKLYQLELAFALAKENPFPIEIRHSRIHNLVSKLVKRLIVATKEGDGYPLNGRIKARACHGLKKSSCNGSCVYFEGECRMQVPQQYIDEFKGNLLDELFHGINATALRDTTSIPTSHSIVLTEEDLDNSKLKKIYSTMENPYVELGKVVDVYIDEIISKHVWSPVDPTTVLTTTWRDKMSTILSNLTKKVYTSNPETGQGFCINEAENPNNEWLIRLFKYADQMAGTGKSGLLTVANIKLIAVNSVITDHNKGKDGFAYDFKMKNAYVDDILSKTNEEISTKTLTDIIQDDAYRFSEYELIIISNMLRLNIVVFARKGKRHPKGVKLIKPSLNSNLYIMVWLDPPETINIGNGKKAKYDKYNVITRNRTDVIFTPETDRKVIDYVVELVEKDYLSVDNHISTKV
jgi:hypothetical protein